MGRLGGGALISADMRIIPEERWADADWVFGMAMAGDEDYFLKFRAFVEEATGELCDHYGVAPPERDEEPLLEDFSMQYDEFGTQVRARLMHRWLATD